MTISSSRPILCPKCRQIVGSQDTACPHCGLMQPRAWWRRALFFHGIEQDPEMAVKALIYANIAMFVLTLLLHPKDFRLSMDPFTFLTPGMKSLLLLGATGTIPIDRFGRWWTLLSASYLHGGLLHIVFNMIALKQIWLLISREYGPYRTFTIYTLGGVAGFYLSYLARIPMTIGASAAVCGLMGAALYYGKSRGGIYGTIIYKQISGWVIGLFLFGLVVPGINNWGHGGGILGGIALGFFLGYEERRKETYFHRFLGTALLFGTVLVMFYAVSMDVYLGSSR